MRAHEADALGEFVIPPDQFRNWLRHISGGKRFRFRLIRPEVGALIAAVRQSPDPPSESVALSRDRADQAAGRADGTPQRRDFGLQVFFLAHSPGPYPPHQRVL